jgi:dTDP-L-rhamnose 4-epimerase
LGLDSLDQSVHHKCPDYLRDDVDYCFADLRYFTPDERFADVEQIVHLAALGGVTRAAREPANVISANVGGTARLLEFARSWPLRRVILASSFSVYGSNYSYRVPGTDRLINGYREMSSLERGDFEVRDRATGAVAEIVPIDTSAPPNPLETYAASKYMQELCFRGFDVAPVTILRFSSVYGDRLRLDDGEATIIARLAGWIRNGTAPTLFEDGQQIRDWVYVGDIAELITRIAQERATGQLINVCSGVPNTLLGACEILNAVFQTEVKPQVNGAFRPGDMRHCLGDPADFAVALGRQPLAFDEGASLSFGSHNGRG